MQKTPNLGLIRDEIDSIDQQVVQLLAQRFELVQQVLQYKQQTGKAVFDSNRERELLASIANQAAAIDSPLSENAVRKIFQSILHESRAVQLQKSCTVLGPAGTYSHAAATALLGASTQTEFASRISDVASAVAIGRTGLGLIPVENRVAGSVSETLDSLWASEVTVVAQSSFPIRHCLLGTTSNPTTIASHPQPLEQCKNWLKNTYPTTVQTATTSTSAAAILAQNDPNTAAIASEIAAQVYDLQILARDIQDYNDNFTRFFVIAKEPLRELEQGDAAGCWFFTLPHQTGTLADVLATMAKHNANLTNIVSRPQPQTPWEYVFFVEAKIETIDQYHHVTEALQAVTLELRPRGCYPIV